MSDDDTAIKEHVKAQLRRIRERKEPEKEAA
jgi:hypothetical protein